MKATEQARADLVRIVMAVLEQAIGDEELDCERPASLAVEIVQNMVADSNFLFIRGKVSHITGAIPLGGSADIGVANAYTVYLSAGIEEQICAWCPNPYGTHDPGWEYGICKNCYNEGPPVKS